LPSLVKTCKKFLISLIKNDCELISGVDTPEFGYPQGEKSFDEDGVTLRMARKYFSALATRRV